MKEMKIHIIISVALLLAGYAAAEDKTLPDKLVDVTVAHIKGHGPDEDTAQFIATERVASWERHEEIAGATIPYLKSKESANVAGALAVLYLQQVALANPEPEERTRPSQVDVIRQFAIDYLNLPRDSVVPAAIAAHIAKKEQELCKLQSIVEAVSNQVPEDTARNLADPQH